MNNFHSGWFVIYTKPRHEKKIAVNLGHAGIDCFLPCIKQLRCWSDRKKFIDEPLFPSYVFVKLENSQNYFTTLTISGILYYVREGGRIAIVSETIIDNLKHIVSDPERHIEVTAEKISTGKILLIKEGPFTGFSCEVIQHKGKEKLLVRIQLLQRNVLLDVSSEYLMPASAIQSN